MNTAQDAIMHEVRSSALLATQAEAEPEDLTTLASLLGRLDPVPTRQRGLIVAGRVWWLAGSQLHWIEAVNPSAWLAKPEGSRA